MSDEIGVKATTMAIREQLMNYFKGTCVETLTEGSPVYVTSARANSRENFRYLRLQDEQQNPCYVMLGDLPIMTIQKVPDRVVMSKALLTRSPQLREVYAEITDFLEKYLIGIEVEHDERGIVYANR